MLTRWELGFGAILVNDDDRDRTVDLCLRAVRRWYGAGRLLQSSEPGRHSQRGDSPVRLA
jgi:hypothetical protein